MPKYRQGDALKLQAEKLAALAFIRVSDLVATFESLPTSFLNDELRLLAYFDNTWIGQSAGDTPSAFKPSVQERRRETKGSRTWLPPIKQYDVNLLYLLLILYHLLLSLFKTCPTDFEDTLM